MLKVDVRRARDLVGLEWIWNRDQILSDSRVLESEDSGFWKSPRPVLEHCNSAPVQSNSNSLLYRGHDPFLSRSKTNKKESPKYDLKLGRLSESEKKKIIEDLVKIQNDSTVEVDVACNAPVASELLELDAVNANTI